MRLLNDEPVLVDALSRSNVVHEIMTAVVECDPPQVFALHGDWGQGKTSVLHQIHYQISGTCPQQTSSEIKRREAIDKKADKVGRFSEIVNVVWFEAWKYQNELVPVVALLHEIRSQLAWHIRMGKRVSKTFEVTVRGALLSMEELTKKIGVQATKIEQAGKDWETEHLAATLPSNTIRDLLTDAIDKLLRPTARRTEQRVLVIIDDLDRCESDAAYRLLEGLKIYLTLPNCVFLLGVNQRIVEDAIAQRMPNRGSPEDGARKERATAYMGKLCQNVWLLPVVQRPKDLLLEWLRDNEGDDVVLEWIARAMQPDHDYLPPNPRRLKAFANLLKRFRLHLSRQHGDPNDQEMIREAKALLLVAYIYQFHHDVFRWWERDSNAFPTLVDWARNLGSTDRTPLPTLTRPYIIASDDKMTPTPQYTSVRNYVDVESVHVFWMQQLAHELGDENVSVKLFAPYLHATFISH